MKLHKLSPARLIALSFFLVILIGAGLLMLPIASKGAPAAPLDALFTATSATCVTGLIVRDTFTGWTTFGQIVIITLIQLGGLGFMTVITLVSFAVGKRLSLYDRKVLMQSAGNTTLNGVGGLIRRIVPFTFVFELTGAALLATRFVPAFEQMLFRGDTIAVSVPTTELRDEILRSKTGMLMRIAELAGVTGRIELEITVNEQIRAARPIRLEDRVKYITEKNPLVAELRKALDLEVE